MFDLSKKYEVDNIKEIEGVWEPIGGGAELLIARIGNPNFQKEYMKIPKAIQTALNDKTIPDDEAGIILASILGKTILLGWKGLGDKGKELKYSEKNAIDYLNKFPDFQSLVIDLANDRELFHKNELEKDIKN